MTHETRMDPKLKAAAVEFVKTATRGGTTSLAMELSNGDPPVLLLFTANNIAAKVLPALLKLIETGCFGDDCQPSQIVIGRIDEPGRTMKAGQS